MAPKTKLIKYTLFPGKRPVSDEKILKKNELIWFMDAFTYIAITSEYLLIYYLWYIMK